jgi:hypothetical protein
MEHGGASPELLSKFNAEEVRHRISVYQFVQKGI